ncbi:unnamed protein product [Rodentolepis nana]|uniref:Aromatic-L-amino-acid decarboxylase n=1 Tax=Rodentolepis nana TaxID=102285 RepID=A0A3P7TUJ1_RODNA|nr:unnamed protein product [Rodentolepis nana]
MLASQIRFKNWSSVTSTFAMEAQYLNYSSQGIMPDYHNWQLSFGRKFRSLKLWFVIRKFGITGLQKYIRQVIIGFHNFAFIMQERKCKLRLPTLFFCNHFVITSESRI